MAEKPGKEDKTNIEAERLLKFILSLKKPPEEQSAKTYNDPQIMRIIGFLESELAGEEQRVKILDYGCGKGPLITELVKLKQFRAGPHQYIGVNHGPIDDVKDHAVRMNLYNRPIQPLFYTTEEFENFTELLDIDLIFMRNVTHEVPLKELGRRFFYILRSLKRGGKLYLLDMCMLHKGRGQKGHLGRARF